jgi:hypothetical protein
VAISDGSESKIRVLHRNHLVQPSYDYRIRTKLFGATLERGSPDPWREGPELATCPSPGACGWVDLDSLQLEFKVIVGKPRIS